MNDCQVFLKIKSSLITKVLEDYDAPWWMKSMTWCLESTYSLTSPHKYSQSLTHRLETWQEIEHKAWPTGRCRVQEGAVETFLVVWPCRSQERESLYPDADGWWKFPPTGPQALLPSFNSLQILITDLGILSPWFYDSWWPPWHSLKNLTPTEFHGCVLT